MIGSRSQTHCAGSCAWLQALCVWQQLSRSELCAAAQTGQMVALKKLRMERERDGMPVTSVREVRVLQACRHANLVHLLKVVTGPKLDRYCRHCFTAVVSHHLFLVVVRFA